MVRIPQIIGTNRFTASKSTEDQMCLVEKFEYQFLGILG